MFPVLYNMLSQTNPKSNYNYPNSEDRFNPIYSAMRYTIKGEPDIFSNRMREDLE
jgi:hypothetical protein